MFPLILAAQTGLPLLDGDSIGRAFPELQMCTFMIYGTTPGLPMALSHEGGMLLTPTSLAVKVRRGIRPMSLRASRWSDVCAKSAPTTAASST